MEASQQVDHSSTAAGIEVDILLATTAEVSSMKGLLLRSSLCVCAGTKAGISIVKPFFLL